MRCVLLFCAIACAEPAPDPARVEEERAIEPAEPATPASPWIDVNAATLAAALRAERAPYLLVNVWSTWCDPCVEEMPEVIATATDYRARGLGLVLISADAPSQRDAALAFLREQRAPFPSFFKTGSDDAFIGALHPAWTGALPFTVLFDRERRAVHHWQEPVDRASLRGPIEALLEGGSR
jgi:thiol-disulfide isomerase/thioredoxin